MLQQTARRGSARRLTVFLFVAWAAVAAVATPAARGQLIPLVPDPITTPELMDCAEAVGLSSQQRLQLLSLHDDYKQRYRQFEDHDIRKLQDALLDIAMQFTRGQFSIPERRELEDLLEQYRRVHAKAQTIDRTLFGAVGGIVADDQMPALQNARTRRELATYQAVVFELVHEFNHGAGVNLAEIVGGLDGSPGEIEQIDLILPGYESAMLRKARNIYAVLNEAVGIVLDTVDELGLRGMTPEQMMETFQDEEVQLSLQATFDEASKPLQAAAFELSQLNLRTFHRLLPVLAPANVADLRDRYYSRAYHDVYHGPGAWRERYRKALALDGLDGQRRQAIGAQRDDFVRQDDQLADNMVNLVEASREYRTFGQFSGEADDKDEEKIDDLRRRREALGERAEAALHALLGPELTAQLEGPDQEGHESTHVTQIVKADGTRQVIVDEGAARAESTDRPGAQAARRFIEDPLLPAPIDAKEVDLLAAQLGWNDDEKAVLSALLDDYRDEFDRLRTAPPESGQGAGEEQTDAEQAEAIRALFDALCEADDAFFDGANALATDEAQQRLVRRHHGMRSRHVATEAARKSVWSYRDDEEGFLDLVSIIASVDVPEPARAAVDEIEEGYTARVAPIVRRRLDAAWKAHRRMTMFRNLNQREGRASRTASEAMMERWRQAQSEARDCNKQIVAINRQTLQQVLAKLPDDAAWTLRYEYNRAAYPDIFRDRSSAEEVLAAARALPDLTGRQRERIDELTYEYRSDYFDLSERMVGLRRKRDFDPMGFQMPSREDIEGEIELQRLHFDREELTARARTHLRLVLTEAQAGLIPALERRRPRSRTRGSGL